MVFNTFTTFKFKFTGSKEQFFQKITKWVEEGNIEKGKKYRIKDSHFTLQSGSIMIQFSLTEQSPSLLDVMVIGFTKGDHPALLCCIPCTCWIGEYPGFKPNKALSPPHKALLGPGRKGWNDMMNLFAFLEITDYQTEEQRGIYERNFSSSQGTTIKDR